MDPLTMGLITGGVSLFGNLFSQHANAQQVQQQENFQQYNADTTAQRAVADYKAAGLNPALAYQSREPAPSGSMTQLGDPTSGVVSNGIQAAQAKQAYDQQDAVNILNNRKIMADTSKVAASRDVDLANKASIDLDNAQKAIVQPLDAQRIKQDILLNSLKVPRATVEAEAAGGFQKLITGARSAYDNISNATEGKSFMDRIANTIGLKDNPYLAPATAP